MSLLQRFRRDELGQGLVEFSICLPVLMLLIFGLIEWSFVMNTQASVNFASRDGAMLAAEGGNNIGTDCMVLSRIERDLVAPALPPRIQNIQIYRSDKNGGQVGSYVNVYSRFGSITCDYADGTSLTVPYTLTGPGYLEGTRCDVLAGCGGTQTTVDTVGVRITYEHAWVSYVGQTIAPTLTLYKSTAIRIEPQL